MKKTAATLFLGGALLAAPHWADTAPLQRQIDALQRDLESERQMYLAEKVRKEASDRSSRSRLDDMREQTRRAKREADSLKAILAAQGRPGLSQAAEQKRMQKWNRRFAAALADQVDSALAKLGREELPYYAGPKERALKDLSRGLRAGVIAPDQGLGQAFDHLSEILAWGSKVEAAPGAYTSSTNPSQST